MKNKTQQPEFLATWHAEMMQRKISGNLEAQIILP
jgi:hypothetical protein